MSPSRLICAGGAGSAIVAICCFTPALVLLFGAIGLSAWLAWADYLLLPALLAFMAVAAIGFYRLRRRRGDNACGASVALDRTGSGARTRSFPGGSDHRR